eukprot:TRINITY_DN16420_c0_g1_i1.p1 TRINITY_DN16420_c0_g1~~TRINITY_DN16420_c0_g1_i1.p1  ORF type:complete len:602 (+),score=155.87 TRINITY_DN16420_c0_g1_i1:34-1806(+)
MAIQGREDCSDTDEELADEDATEVDEDDYAQGAPKLPRGVQKLSVLREAPVALWERGRPTPLTLVAVRLRVRLKGGVEVRTAGVDGEPLRFILGRSPRQEIIGLELALQTMRISEIACFEVAPDFAYGDLGSYTPAVPPKSSLLLEVELLDFEAVQDLLGNGAALLTATSAAAEQLGPTPQRGAEVVMSGRCVDRRGAVLEEHRHLRHVVGTPAFGALSRVLTSALLRLREGESARVVLARECCVPAESRFDDAVLELELERVFVDEDVSLAADGSLLKRVLHRASASGAADSAAAPLSSRRAHLRLEAITDGATALAGFRVPRTFDFAVGEGGVCDALEFAVQGMVVGEEVSLTCRPPLPQCGELLDSLNVEKLTKVVLTLKLLSVDVSVDASSLTGAAKIAHARACKESAGQLYRRQRYALAAFRYAQILDFLSGKNDEDVSQGEEARELRLLCLLNQAAALLKLSDYRGARRACDEALELDGQNVKALYRRASASFGLCDYDEAILFIPRLMQQDPASTEAKQLAAKIRQAQLQSRREGKEAAMRMLSTQPGDQVVSAPHGRQAPSEVAQSRRPFPGVLAKCMPCLA